MRPLLIFLLVSLGLTASSQLFIRNTTVVDVENKKLLPSQNVLVENGKITAIGKNIQANPSMKVIDGSGKYLIPGLVDAHVHFFQSGGIYTRPDAVDLRKYKPYADEVAWVHRSMESF